ncbi:MAG: DUF2157 domain-containing protein [Leptolyngbya sp. IPPAS B-1204]|nr:DUF2157 domain-containing protein [Elainella sp. C42_A2020_010]RNJ69268.1 MAG: DUF2157 domain-containing protein [Leptolyngbya sp. IPPAS B-1204]
MVTEKFRRQLRQEAEKWWTEGLIDARLYQQLAERYQLQELERDASHRFIAILMGLGSVLLGLAAITFVAANWQVWSRLVKVLLLLSLFLGVNAAGFYLWRRPRALTGQQRLGHGLLLLGALLLGANLALLSQMFHQSGNAYELFLVWGIGVIAMAYSLRLVSLGVLAWILIVIGYWSGWVAQFSSLDTSLWLLMVLHMPLVMAGLFVPLAYRCRSQVLFGLAGIGVAVSFCFNCISLWNSSVLPPNWLVAVAVTLPPALLWSYSSRIWRSSSTVDPFQSVARSLALWYMGVTYFLFAIRVVWRIPIMSVGENSWTTQALIDVVILAGLTGLGWMQLRHDWRRSWLQERALHSGMVALLLLLGAVTLIWNFGTGLAGSPPVVGVIMFNLLLFLLAVGLIRDGLALGERGTFWGGMVLLVLGIISRMLEYNTGLLLKSIVFALCGAGIIAAGLWFERRVKPNSARSLPSASQETL